VAALATTILSTGRHGRALCTSLGCRARVEGEEQEKKVERGEQPAAAVRRAAPLIDAGHRRPPWTFLWISPVGRGGDGG
jgi:hypothetical protein